MGSPSVDASLAADAELAGRIGRGDGAAEEEFVRRFQPGLLAIACVRVGRAQAQDLVQETMTAALLNLRRGDWLARGPLGAYLATILRRASRRVALGPPLAESSDLEGLPAPRFDPVGAVDRARLRRSLLDAVQRLPERHRETLLRHYFDGQSVEEIAREVSIPRGTVLSRLHHARRKIARVLNQSGVRGH